MVVVDTNVLVDVLRGMPQAVDALEQIDDEIVVPSMVRFEVLAGAWPSELAAIRRLLALCIDAPVDGLAVDAAAALARRYAKSHANIDPIDYVVAATTQLLGATLMTRNVKHFPMFQRLKSPY